MPELLEIDPSKCWIRHVTRGGTVTVLGATFGPEPLEGLGGRQGWQTATPERRLSDDGSMVVRLPNTTGEDGIPHVERFALLTDPAYRPGEEWLELYREPHDLLFVGTPVEWTLSPAELELTLQDGLVLLANQRASEIDLWRAEAPRDVIHHYTGGKWLVAGADFTRDPAPAGWTVGDPAAGGGAEIGAGGSASYALPAGHPQAAAWEAEARVRTGSTTGAVSLTIGDHVLTVTLAGDGTATTALEGGLQSGATATEGADVPTVGPALYLRLVARGEWLHAFVNGGRVISRRRILAEPDAFTVATTAPTAAAALELAHVTALEPLLLRGAELGDLHLPGAPTGGGLDGSYFAEPEAQAAAPLAEGAYHPLTLSPLLEPAGRRLERTLAYASADPPAWPGVATPAGEYWSARFAGSIYLDLAAGDLELEVDAGAGANRARLWIAGLELVTTGTDDVTGSLRAELGEVSGWYPLRLELSHHRGGAGLALRSGPVGGPYVTVPTERLSPLGTFTSDVRFESHRELLGQLTEAFGYQWTLEPRSLESGTFPGELAPRVRAGRDTDVVIDELNGQEARSSGSASDCVDGLLIDAGGLADRPEDAPPLTAEILLPELARDHLVLSQAYESLSEITEEAFLRQRGESILALRSSPAETLAARPTSSRPLVRTLVEEILGDPEVPQPLVLSGELARMRWEPGDGVRLELPGLRARDLTPRQLTAVAWDCRPDGVGPPTVGFRQRPRGMRAALARALRTSLALARAR